MLKRAIGLVWLLAACIALPACTGSGQSSGNGQPAGSNSWLQGVQAAEAKQVGDERYGYFNVPDSWQDNSDYIAASSSLSAFDAEGSMRVVAMRYDDSDAEMTLADALASIDSFMEANAAEDVKTESVALAGCGIEDVTKASCYLPALELHMAIYLFVDEDGVLRYLSAEGATPEELAAASWVVEQGYSLTP